MMKLRRSTSFKYLIAVFVVIVIIASLAFYSVDDVLHYGRVPQSRLQEISPAFIELDIQEIELATVRHAAGGADAYIQSRVSNLPTFETFCQRYGFTYGPESVGASVLKDFGKHCSSFPASAGSPHLRSLIATRFAHEGNLLGFYDETSGMLFIQIRRR